MRVTTPQMTTLCQTDLVDEDPPASSDIERQGIPSSAPRRRVILVRKDRVRGLRRQASEAACPRAAESDYEIFRQVRKRSAPRDSVQNINILRALEGEMARPSENRPHQDGTGQSRAAPSGQAVLA